MLKRLPLALLLVGTSSAWAQQVISAHSGVIHFVEGQVTLEGQPVQPKFAEFPDVKNGQTLATEDGRAEVLLTPGVILRIGENSSFKMISNSRADTRLEIVSGSAIVEVGELLPTNAITLLSKDAHIELVKKGLYRVDVDTDPGKLRVYEGEARITASDQSLVVRKGRQVLMGAVLDMGGFDVKETDALMRWASRRSEYLAQANISSARTASNSGYGSGSGLLSGFSSGSGYGYGLGSGYGAGGYGGAWAYNPWYGMFTYMPYGNNMYYSPFGYPYYSPSTVGFVNPVSNSGSAFALSSASTSPHFATSNGSYNFAPRGSYGAGSTSNAAASSATGARAGASSVSGSSGGASSGASAGASRGGMGGRK